MAKKLSKPPEIQFEIRHTPEFMKKKLPHTGNFKNGWTLTGKTKRSGIQYWQCQYRHLIYPKYNVVEMTVYLKINPTQSKWKEFKVNVSIPLNLGPEEYLRIPKETIPYIRSVIYESIGRYF